MSVVVQNSFYGVLLGIFFPFLSLVLTGFLGESGKDEGILYSIILTAPFVLGFAGLLIGKHKKTILKQNQELQNENHKLEKLVEKKVKEILEKEQEIIRVQALKESLGTFSHYINNSVGIMYSFAQTSKKFGENKSNDLENVVLSESKKIQIVLRVLEEMVKSNQLKLRDYSKGIKIFDVEEEVQKRVREFEKLNQN